MTKEEADLIITEQNKSTEEILKAVAKVKSDYHELCKLKDMRIAELEKENAELKKQLEDADNATDCFNKQEEIIAKAKEIIREFVQWATWQGSNCPNFKSIQDKAEQFLKEVEK